MKRSFLAVTLALGLSAGFVGVASAEDQGQAPGYIPTQQSALVPSQAVEQQATAAYNANINPLATVPTTGIYDDGDRFTGPTGTPLPGWGAVNGEGGDS